MDFSRFRKKKTYILIILAALIILLGLHLASRGIFTEYLDVLQEFALEHPFLGAATFFLLAALSVFLGPFSSSPLVPVAIFVWGVPATFLLLISGWIFGDILVYAAGRFIGHALVGKMLGHERLIKWTHFLENNLTFSILLLFRLAAPSETGYAFGILKYPFGKYLLISFLSELPFAALVTFAGDALLDAGWRLLVVLGGLWAILVGASALLLKRRMKGRWWKS